jgi:hypothetical protein
MTPDPASAPAGRACAFNDIERAVWDVYEDGQAVLSNGRLLNLDYRGAVRKLQDAQKRTRRIAETSIPKGRTLETLPPLSLPTRTQS